MRRIGPVWLLLPGLLALAACGGQTGSEGFEDDGPPGSGGTGGDGSGGTGGPPGTVPPQTPDACVDDAECMARLEETARDLAEPRAGAPRTLVAASCESAEANAGCTGTPSCTCVFTRQNRLGEINAEAIALGLGFEAAGCDVRSRGGACLIAAGDFAGCEPGDDCSCFDACAEALDAIAADEARTLDVEARHAACVDRACRVVLRVDDRCHAGFSPRSDASPYDCALSDEEILRRAYPPPDDAGADADCTGGCDGGSGVPTVLEGRPCGFGVCGNCYDDAPPLDCSDADAG